ncbi:MAG: hypothetical protein WCI92_10035 [Bacteroidota bacterium]
MVKKIKWKLILNWVGFLVSIIGIAYVVRKLSSYSNQIDLSSLTYVSILCLILLSIIYFLSNFFLALAWHSILDFLGVKTSKKNSIQIYGISQIGKYIPGNIFQFAGRQTLGISNGISPIPLAKSAIWEISLLIISGLFFFILIIPNLWTQLSFELALFVFSIVIFISLFFSYKLFGGNITSAVKWYVLFLLFSGLIFYFAIMITTDFKYEVNSQYIGIIGVYVIAWLAGLLTPGAPAGIGVREMVFLTILHSTINESDLLKSIIAGRCVTIGGDVYFYLFSLFIKYSNVFSGYKN